MVTIDGSIGEGGGQVLRSLLALSIATEQPFRIENIRAGRKKPGLQRQHLAAVNAATEISQASVKGAHIGSLTLEFCPGKVKGGKYTFAVGSAGSTTLVLQTILPPLLTATEKSEITITGGTHNPWAPPFDFLQKSFFPLVHLMGPQIEANLIRYGFYPAGGGCIQVLIEPVKRLSAINIMERGSIRCKLAKSLISSLPKHIAHREIDIVRAKLEIEDKNLRIEQVESDGPGNVLIVEIVSEHITEVFTGFGVRGVRAESVAEATVKAVKHYISSGAPVGVYLADQLLIPMTLAENGSFLTLTPSTHTTTNIEVIKLFTKASISLSRHKEDNYRIVIS